MADTNSNLVGSPVHLAPELVLGGEFSGETSRLILCVHVCEFVSV